MPTLTLTFDNGPTPEATPLVLDVLAERNLPAYFFVVGRQLARPGGVELARRAVAAGHRVGNHSMTHAVPLGDLEDPRAVAEVADAQRLLDDAGLADADRLFRPFGGGGRLDTHLLSEAVVEHLQRERYTLVLWNSVPHDWEDVAGWPDRARRDIERCEHTVLVLHDLPTGAMEHLGSFVDRARADGVEVSGSLPPSCTPVVRGVRTGAFEHLVAARSR